MKTTPMHKTTHLLISCGHAILGALLCAFVAACGGIEGDFEELAAAALGSQQQALGEPTCATTPLTLAGLGEDWATVPLPRAPYCGPAGSEAATPSTSYDNAGCPDQFIVSALLTSTKPVAYSAYGRVMDQTIAGSQTRCENTTLNFTVFGLDAKKGWTEIASLSLAGRWSYFGCDITSSASAAPLHGWRTLVQVDQLSYSKVRVAVHAEHFPSYYKQPVKVRVAGGIAAMAMPCPG